MELSIEFDDFRRVCFLDVRGVTRTSENSSIKTKNFT